MQYYNEILWIAALFINFAVFLLFYRFSGKTGLFIWIGIATVIANIQVTKLIDFFGFTITLGNILYATTFMATDLLSENYSKESASKSIKVGFISFICMIILMKISVMFIPAEADFVSSSLNTIFDFMPRISLASLAAFAVSQYHDVWAYDFWKRKFPETRFIFIRNNMSTVVSQLIDSTIFTLVAFAGVYEFNVLISIILSTCILKWIIAVLDTGCIYLAADWYRKGKVREL